MVSPTPNDPFTAHPALEVLASGGGPYATAYLAMPSAQADAADRLAVTTRRAIHDLEASGVPRAVVDRFAEAADRVDHDDGTHAVVVADADHAWAWPVTMPADVPIGLRVHDVRTYWATLPRVAPLLALHQNDVPRLLVLIDHAGADLHLVGGRTELDHEVSGDTLHIHRSKPGGLSQPRYQQRAENTWERNAADVASVVADVFDDEHPALVAIAGDPHAVGFLSQHLPDRVREVTVTLDHGDRSAGVDTGRVGVEFAAAFTSWEAARIDSLTETFGSAQANGVGVSGVHDTLQSLFEGRADTVLMDSDLDDDRTAFHGPLGEQVAADADTLESLGIASSEGPLAEVAARAATATGARVVYLDPAREQGRPTAGLGAVLRG